MSDPSEGCLITKEKEVTNSENNCVCPKKVRGWSGAGAYTKKNGCWMATKPNKCGKGRNKGITEGKAFFPKLRIYRLQLDDRRWWRPTDKQMHCQRAGLKNY